MAWKFNAILKFHSADAKRGMEKAERGFKSLKKSVKSASDSLSKMSAGVRSAAIAATPLTVGMGHAIKTAAEFEQQMSSVQAVLRASKDDMIPLVDMSKRLGITTVFTAKQAGEGAQFLAQAGFEMHNIVGALPGVLDAAAASGITLGESANIVAGNIGAFGLAASDATRVADVFATTSAVTNTTFLELAESMKYAAPITSKAGMTLESTASALGILANAGMKGSLAGTALKNALLKLSTPSKKTLALFGGREGFNNALMELGKNGKMQLRPMEVMMANMGKAVTAARNPLEAAATAAEIFGIRGATQFSAFQGQMLGTTAVTEKNFEQLSKGAAIAGEAMTYKIGEVIPTLVALRYQIAGAEGASKLMAKIKLNNLIGDVTLLTSAVSGLEIEMGGIFQDSLREITSKATQFFTVMVMGFQIARRGTAATAADLDSISENGFKGMLKGMTEFAQGFIDGFNELRDAASDTFNSMRAWLEPIFGNMGTTNKELGKMVAKIAIIGAIAAPILGAIAIGFFILGPIIGGIVATFSFLASVISIVATTFSILFTVGSTIVGVLGAPFVLITAAILGVGAGILGIYQRWDEVKQAFQDKGFFAAVWVGFKAFFSGIGDLLMLPINLAKDAIFWILGKLADVAGFLGKGAMKMAIEHFVNKDSSASSAPPTIKNPSGFAANGTGAVSSNLADETMKQKAITQPASTSSITQAFASSLPAQTGGGNSSSTQTIKVEVGVHGKISGQDINIAGSRAQIVQAEKNGRTMNPSDKRKLIQNGAMAPAR